MVLIPIALVVVVVVVVALVVRSRSGEPVESGPVDLESRLSPTMRPQPLVGTGAPSVPEADVPGRSGDAPDPVAAQSTDSATSEVDAQAPEAEDTNRVFEPDLSRFGGDGGRKPVDIPWPAANGPSVAPPLEFGASEDDAPTSADDEGAPAEATVPPAEAVVDEATPATEPPSGDAGEQVQVSADAAPAAIGADGTTEVSSDEGPTGAVADGVEEQAAEGQDDARQADEGRVDESRADGGQANGDDVPLLVEAPSEDETKGDLPVAVVAQGTGDEAAADSPAVAEPATDEPAVAEPATDEPGAAESAAADEVVIDLVEAEQAQLQPEPDPVDQVLDALIQRARERKVGVAEVAAELIEQAELEDREVDEVLADLVVRSEDDTEVRTTDRRTELTLFNDAVPTRPGELSQFERLGGSAKKRVIIRVLCLLVAQAEDSQTRPREPRSDAETRSWPLARAIWPVASTPHDETDPDLPARPVARSGR